MNVNELLEKYRTLLAENLSLREENIETQESDHDGKIHPGA